VGVDVIGHEVAVVEVMQGRAFLPGLMVAPVVIELLTQGLTAHLALH
jgi:hypothetical protein